MLDADNVNTILKSYIYANGEILMQHNGNHTADKYFYLHDRLGSVREVIDANGTVKNHYTYKPFGEILDTDGSVDNPFLFTGQYYDYESGQYYLRARQYDPQLMRLTGRDSMAGEKEEPLSLHKYLYCENEPINKRDPIGLWYEWIHRSFGKYGHGDVFDYSSLDREHHPWNRFYTHEHFKSKKEAFHDIAKAIASGDPKAFEYAVHEYQDTYTHYDRGWTNNYHPPDPRIDDMDWTDPEDVAAYYSCYQMTIFFEKSFFKSNMDFWFEHTQAELSKSNPWLSIVDPSGPPRGTGSRYLDPIFRAQLGEE